MGECFFWYRPTRVVPDQRPLNGRCCCCCYCKLYFVMPRKSVIVLKASLFVLITISILIVFQAGLTFCRPPNDVISTDEK